MKKFLSKTLVYTIFALLLVSTLSMSIPVKAAIREPDASPLSFYKLNFSFAGTCNISKNCTGMFMDVMVRATASNNNNETITLEIYVVNTGAIKTYTFLSDGQDHTYKNIFLGLSGGSNVRFTFTGANPAITISVYGEVGS